MNEIYILGAGAFAKKAYNCAKANGTPVKAFIVESADRQSPIQDIPAIGEADFNTLPPVCGLFIAIGNGEKRSSLMATYEKRGWAITSLVHPLSSVAFDVQIGQGVFIAAGCVIEPNCTIGKGAIIDIGVMIDHECIIEPFVHIRSTSSYPSGCIIDGRERVQGKSSSGCPRKDY